MCSKHTIKQDRKVQNKNFNPVTFAKSYKLSKPYYIWLLDIDSLGKGKEMELRLIHKETSTISATISCLKCLKQIQQST